MHCSGCSALHGVNCNKKKHGFRENKFGDCTISQKKTIDKFEHEVMIIKPQHKTISLFAAWKDNKSVYAASNCDAIEPSLKCNTGIGRTIKGCHLPTLSNQLI